MREMPDSDAGTGLAVAWPVTDLQAELDLTLPGIAVELLTMIDSTNSELMRRARDGQAAPVLLVAEQQSVGRGRLGRPWVSATVPGSDAPDPRASLTFSLGLLMAPADWSGLSLAVGLAVAEALHPELRLKWPNDLWLQQRKLGGILIETASLGASRYVVVGIGLNIQAPRATGLSGAPAWLSELWPAVTAPAALQRIAAPLVRTLLQFEQQGFAPFAPAYRARDGLLGLPVVLSTGQAGVAQGVDERGGLRFSHDQGILTLTSAEVSVRPLADIGLHPA